MDRLSTLLDKFPIRARRIGAESETNGSQAQDGQLHIAYRGVTGFVLGAQCHTLTVPSVILVAPGQPMPHFDAAADAMVVSAWLSFDGGQHSPIAQALTHCAVLPTSVMSLAEGALTWLAIEATHEHCGRDAALSNLFELVLIQMLRQLMDGQLLASGLIAGLADPRLALALTAMHDAPHRRWSVELLAQTAHMSRAAFAARFSTVVGVAPADYLATWRTSLVQKLLREGQSLDLIAPQVGYESPAALARLFRKKLGMSPKTWRACAPVPVSTAGSRS